MKDVIDMLKRLVKNVRLKIKLETYLCFLILTSMLLCGCGLLPQEEETMAVPILNSYDAKSSNNLITVKKGALVSEVKIKCTYTQAKEESLSFPVSGLVIKDIYYKVGDSVKKGDLLAQLELGTMETDIDNLKYELGKNKLLLSQAKKLMNLEIAKLEIMSDGSGHSEEEDNNITLLKNQYKPIMQTYEDNIYIGQKKLEILEEKKETYSIYASMDGTISYVSDISEGATSSENKTIIKIIDNTSSVFKVGSTNASLLQVGEEVTVITKDNSYQVIVKQSENDDKSIYLQLKSPDIDLKIGDAGYVQYIIDEREDTLYLPRTAVHKVKDSYYVYYIDETGVQNMKPVEIGLESETNVEILSGLSKGESVINN